MCLIKTQFQLNDVHLTADTALMNGNLSLKNCSPNRVLFFGIGCVGYWIASLVFHSDPGNGISMLSVMQFPQSRVLLIEVYKNGFHQKLLLSLRLETA